MDTLLLEGKDDLSDEMLDKFASRMRELMKSRLAPRPEVEKGTVRMSNIGSACARKLYIGINDPKAKEPLDANTIFKFLYGDILEEMLLFLAEASGHSVVGQQDEQDIAGVKGHRDAVIDGVVVDAKSASPFAFTKFQNGLTKETDAFGYITQGQSYLEAGQKDPLVTDKTRMAFLVCNKVSGERVLDFHEYKKYDMEKAYKQRLDMLASPDMPDRGFEPEPDGYKNKAKEFVPNGNLKLGTFCSYCDVKAKCYPELRTFLASTGPKFFTHIEKEPRMYEVTKDRKAEEKEAGPTEDRTT